MKAYQVLLTGILASSIMAASSLPCLAQKKPAKAPKPPAIAPAEPLEEGWEEIDQRLIFLMVRLANTEASLEAVENAIGKNSGKRNAKTGEAKLAEQGNAAMDRKGGGPVKWSVFYGRTAEKFFYHPTDRNSTYHTTTILSQQSPKNDNSAGPGVPSRQGLPVHQRPPQFDYIYQANRDAKARAEQEASELKNKIDALMARRQKLEAEQSALWCEVAFRAVSHYDLDKKPLYRFEPLLTDTTPEALQHADSMKAAASFMRVALSIVASAQKNQATTFGKIKPAVAEARQTLNDKWLELAVDVTDRKTTEGKFAALAKRLDDVASNLSDSYEASIDGDREKEQLRKDTFRGLLQESLVVYAQIILALDEMCVVMRDDWKIKPDVKKPLVVKEVIALLKHDDSSNSPAPSAAAIVRPGGNARAVQKPAEVAAPKIVATARQLFANGSSKTHKLYSNGSVNGPYNSAKWKVDGARIVFSWPNASAPGGAIVDDCALTNNGRSYSGKNQNGVQVRGEIDWVSYARR